MTWASGTSSGPSSTSCARGSVLNFLMSRSTSWSAALQLEDRGKSSAGTCITLAQPFVVQRRTQASTSNTTTVTYFTATSCRWSLSAANQGAGTTGWQDTQGMRTGFLVVRRGARTGLSGDAARGSVILIEHVQAVGYGHMRRAPLHLCLALSQCTGT